MSEMSDFGQHVYRWSTGKDIANGVVFVWFCGVNTEELHTKKYVSTPESIWQQMR